MDALLDGLTDYTSDERGDVGSWLRMACVEGLTSMSSILFSRAGSLQAFSEYLPAKSYHAAISGILKQGVERLDNVRQKAGQCILRLLALPLPDVPDKEQWRVYGGDLMRKLFTG